MFGAGCGPGCRTALWRRGPGTGSGGFCDLRRGNFPSGTAAAVKTAADAAGDAEADPFPERNSAEQPGEDRQKEKKTRSQV